MLTAHYGPPTSATTPGVRARGCRADWCGSAPERRGLAGVAAGEDLGADGEGDVGRAVAAEVQPDSREAHLFLADAYQQLGRTLDAARERATAGTLAAPVSR